MSATIHQFNDDAATSDSNAWVVTAFRERQALPKKPELSKLFRTALSTYIADQRASGVVWSELAARFGVSRQALRRFLSERTTEFREDRLARHAAEGRALALARLSRAEGYWARFKAGESWAAIALAEGTTPGALREFTRKTAGLTSGVKMTAAWRKPDRDWAAEAQRCYRYCPVSGNVWGRRRSKNADRPIRSGGMLYGIRIQLHLLAWLLHYGWLPSDREVDHVNRDRSDNRISNLRLATRAENQRNRQACGAASGLKGVVSRGSYWAALIQANGVRHQLGTFATRFGAAAAYDRAAVRLHGKFAATNESLGLLNVQLRLAPAELRARISDLNDSGVFLASDIAADPVVSELLYALRLAVPTREARAA